MRVKSSRSSVAIPTTTKTCSYLLLLLRRHRAHVLGGRVLANCYIGVVSIRLFFLIIIIIIIIC